MTRMTGRILLIALFCLPIACAKLSPSPPTSAQSSSGSGSSAQTVANALPPSSHNYVYEKDGEYGYQPQLSQDQINAGDASRPLVMFRYLGKSRGVYRAQSSTGPFTGVLSCSAPCDYITVVTHYADGEIADRQVMPGDDNSIAAEVMQDAMNGQLRVYGAARRAAQARWEAQRRAARAAWLAAQAHRGPYVTTAVAIDAAFRRDRNATLHVLDGRLLKVSGIVASKSASLVPEGDCCDSVELYLRDGPDPFNYVRLDFQPSQYGAIQGVHAGQHVTALCKSLDLNFPGATPEGCRLLKARAQSSIEVSLSSTPSATPARTPKLEDARTIEQKVEDCIHSPAMADASNVYLTCLSRVRAQTPPP